MTLDSDEMLLVFDIGKKDVKYGSKLTVKYEWGEEERTPTIAC